MYKLQDIRDIHLEITSRCQAKCPMCPRRINGGPLNPFIHLDDITLEIFKKWFPEDFIKQLDSLFMCGNLGDPIVSKDTLEIYQHLRAVNPRIGLAMHTNGSAKSKEWWRKLAKVNVKVTFGLDTGAEFNQINSRINKKVLKHFYPKKRIQLTGASSKKIEVLYGDLHRVKLTDKIYFGPMKTIITNLNNMNKAFGTNLDGILGHDFFAQKRTFLRFEIDPKKSDFFFLALASVPRKTDSFEVGS